MQNPPTQPPHGMPPQTHYAPPRPNPVLTFSRVLAVLAVCISLLALGASGVAVWYAANQSGLPGQSLEAYDLSTPEEAVRSNLLIDARADMRAEIDMLLLRDQEDRDRMLTAIETIRFDRVVEHEDRFAVFYTYRLKGLDEYKVTWLERDPDGNYYDVFVSTYDWEDGTEEQQRIAALIAEWQAKQDRDFSIGM
ncbi:MAG: hypothetical protein ACIAXF_10550 [Phycisphaerales bacterium JB063]